MRSDPAADVHADGSQFFKSFLMRSPVRAARRCPHARLSRHARARNSEIRAGANHGFFERANIPAHIAPNLAQLQNRIGHQLPRSVIGDVAAAIGVEITHAHLRQHALGRQQIPPMPRASLRDHVRMLAQQQHVGQGAGLARRH